MSADSPPPASTRRRLLQFSLRNLLLLTLVLGVVFGVLAMIAREAKRQRQVVADLSRNHMATVDLSEQPLIEWPELFDTGYCDRVNHIVLRRGKFSDIQSWGEFKNLDRLAIIDNVDIDDISGLAEAKKLTELGIYVRNDITDISSLAEMHDLYLLSLTHSKVSDISPLSGMTKLERLYLHHTPLVDVTPLANLPRLRNVSLAHTQISDVQSLGTLESLRRLDLSDTQVSQEERDKLKTLLPHCRID